MSRDGLVPLFVTGDPVGFVSVLLFPHLPFGNLTSEFTRPPSSPGTQHRNFLEKSDEVAPAPFIQFSPPMSLLPDLPPRFERAAR